MLYIAVVRYWDSIAVYLMGVAAFMVYLALAPSHGSSLIALSVLAVLHFVVGYAARDMKVLGLVVFSPCSPGSSLSRRAHRESRSSRGSSAPSSWACPAW